MKQKSKFIILFLICFFITVKSSVVFACSIQDNIITHYTVDTDWIDSYFFHNGTNNNVVFIPGKVDYSADFVKTDSAYVDTNWDLDIYNHNISWSFWIKTKTADTGVGDCGTIIGKISGSSYWNINIYQGKITYKERGGGTTYSLQSNTAINDGTWHHVVVLRQIGSSVKMFIDGEIHGTGADANRNCDSAVDVLIGYGYCAGSFYFNGTLDEISFFPDYILNESEITQMYGCGNDGIPIPSCGDTGGTPTIDSDTYNVTSGIDNTIIWRTSQAIAVNTTDSTPTITFTGTGEGNWSISLYDWNYTTMIANDSDFKCSTVLTNDVSCTLSYNLVAGYNTLYIAGITSEGLETETSISGALNISLITDTVAPYYSLNSTNSTLAGNYTKHSLYWEDDNFGLSGYIFSWCNGTWNGSECETPGSSETISVILQDADTENMEDTYIEDINPNSNFGSTPSHQVGSQIDLGSELNYSFLIKFNLSFLDGVSGVVIQSATLYLYNFWNTFESEDNANITVWLINNQTWKEEEVTFNNFPGHSNLITFNDTIPETVGFDGVGWMKFNVTTGVNTSQSYFSMYINNSNPSSENSPGDYLSFFSKEHNTNTSRRPYLNITYSTTSSSNIWQNDSFVSMTGIGNWSNVTKQLQSEVGLTYAWCVYANDTSNNWNSTSCDNPFTYTSTSSGGDSCTPVLNEDWVITEACIKSSYTTTGTGYTNISTGGKLTLIDASLDTKGLNIVTGDTDVDVLNLTWSDNTYYLNLTG